MGYKTSKKCFFCGEETLIGKPIGKKVICDNCINDMYEALELRAYKLKD